jgi:hypothetical protein
MGMRRAFQVDVSRRWFLHNGGAIVLTGAAVAMIVGRKALAQSVSGRDSTMTQANLHNSAPTRFQSIGDIRLA